MYINFGTVSNTINFGMQMLLGSLVNGPYALITTAVAADLGNKVTSSQALATVTAIIDGTGSIGAALGPLIAGFVADYSWNDVFYMVLIADVIAMLLLYRIVIAEVQKLRRRFTTFHR
jgi:OPA family glycerol-3-phosphate transporter-like MFS transporter 1/2